MSGEPHKPFGRYENVFLTEAEYAELKAEFPDRLERLIEEMSRYPCRQRRTYQNYAAALRIWAENDKKDAPKQGVPDYTCKGGRKFMNKIENINLLPDTEPDSGDYTGEDGLLYCGKCRKPKEAYFPEGKTLFGLDRHPGRVRLPEGAAD